MKGIQELLYEYAEKIRKCPYPGCGKPLLSSTGKIMLETTPATKAFQTRVDGSSPRTIRLREPEHICIDEEENDVIDKKKRKRTHESKRKPKQTREPKRRRESEVVVVVR